MTQEIVVRNVPDLPPEIDRSEYEVDDQGRLVCEWRAASGSDVFASAVYGWSRGTSLDNRSTAVLRRKQSQPEQWTPPQCLQGEEWRGWSISAVKRVSDRNDVEIYSPKEVDDGSWGLVCVGKLTWPARLLGVTLADFSDLKPGQSVPLGPQPKPAWKCSGKLAGSGLWLTYSGKVVYEWKVWCSKPALKETGLWDGVGRIAFSETAIWYLWKEIIGPLPDVEGVPLEERIWEL